MAANVRQKLFLINIDVNTQATLQGYLDQGFVIHQIVPLMPTFTKLLIVYYDPAVDQ
jgi:hypothetical protein